MRGREILLDVSGGMPNRSGRYLVETWRSGRLVPMPGVSRTARWTLGTVPGTVDGYDVSTRAGRRTLVHRHLALVSGDSPETARFAGTATTYVWSRDTWVRTGTNRLTGVDLATAQRIWGCHGITWV